MKQKNIELNVDHIGSQETSITKDEEKVISDYIRKNKTKARSSSTKKQSV